MHVIMNAALDTRMQWLTATFGTSVLLPWERTYLPCHLLESYRSIGTRACAKYFSFPTTRRPKQGLFMSVQNKDYSCLCTAGSAGTVCWPMQPRTCMFYLSCVYVRPMKPCPNGARYPVVDHNPRLTQWRKVSSSRPQSPD